MSPHIWRRSIASALTGAAVVGGLGVGLSAPLASAQPADTSATQPPKRVNPDQVLMMIADQYSTGSGGGQVSRLIDQVMTLRQRGIRPSMASTNLLLAGLDARPNQTPLVEALQATLADQRKQFAQAGVAAPAPGAPAVATPGSPHQPMGPAWSPGNPMDRNDSPIFEMPGR